MEGIDGAVTRIASIRTRFTTSAPSGAFQAALEARMAATTPTPAGPPKAASVGSGVSGSETPALATVALPSFGASYPSTITLGAMTGTDASPPKIGTLPRPAGIPTTVELADTLAQRRVEARNGRLTSADLVPVSGGWTGTARLLGPAAVAWEAMRTAAAVDGIDLRAVDTYRSWESQDRAHRAHLRGDKKANVLPPGRSEHGNGLAVDITNGHIVGPGDPEWSWMRVNGRSFGWYPISNESWHWEFRGVG